MAGTGSGENMNIPQMQNLKIPALALAAGLFLGLGAGQLQVKKEQKVCQDRIKEKDKKIAFIQKKLTEEKSEATSSLEQRYQDEAAKLQAALASEKKRAGALSGQVAMLTDQSQKQEARLKAVDEAAARTKQELQEAQRSNKDLDRDLKKTAGEQQSLQADLKRVNRELGTCTSNNADLAVIAEELVKRYKDKGIGAAILEKEPLTQVKKVELEQLTSQYQEAIEQKKITKK
jgi:chromosome segregation ATPase